MRRATLVLVLGLACFLAPMTAAYALWTRRWNSIQPKMFWISS